MTDDTVPIIETRNGDVWVCLYGHWSILTAPEAEEFAKRLLAVAQEERRRVAEPTSAIITG